MQGAIGRAVAGCVEKAVCGYKAGLPTAHLHFSKKLTDAAGETVEARATFLTSGARVTRTAAAQTTHSTLLIQGPPRVTGTGYGNTGRG